MIEVTYIGPSVASNNIKSISESVGVKLSPLFFAKVSVLVSAILSLQSIGVFIGNTFSQVSLTSLPMAVQQSCGFC